MSLPCLGYEVGRLEPDTHLPGVGEQRGVVAHRDQSIGAPERKPRAPATRRRLRSARHLCDDQWATGALDDAACRLELSSLLFGLSFAFGHFVFLIFRNTPAQPYLRIFGMCQPPDIVPGQITQVIAV